jgi:hypothetical protein
MLVAWERDRSFGSKLCLWATGVARKGGVTHPNSFSSKTNNFYSVAYNSVIGHKHNVTTNHSTREKIAPFMFLLRDN